MKNTQQALRFTAVGIMLLTSASAGIAQDADNPSPTAGEMPTATESAKVLATDDRTKTQSPPSLPTQQDLDTEFALAAGFYAREQWAEAADAFQAFIQHHPGTRKASTAQFFLGESFIQQGDYESASPWYEGFVLENPRHQFLTRAEFRRGEVAYRLNRDRKAVGLLEAFIARHPDHALVEFVLPYLGELRLNRNEPQLAKAAFETSLNMFPAGSLSDQSRYGLARSLQILGAPDDARRFYEYLVKSEGSDGSSFKPQANLQLGKMALSRQQTQAAREMLTIAVEGCVGDEKIEAAYWLARSNMALGDDLGAVELISAFSHQTMPKSIGAVALFDGAVAASKIGRDELACNWLEKLRTLYPENARCDDALVMEIGLHYDRHRYDRVIELRQSMPTDRYDAATVQATAELLGRSWYAKKDFEQTVSVFADLVSQFDRDLDSLDGDQRQRRATWLYLKSLGHVGLKQYDVAARDLELALAYNQAEELGQMITLARATAFFADGQYAPAADDYIKWLTANPERAESSRTAAELTVCYTELEQWENVESAFAMIRQFKTTTQSTDTVQYVAEKSNDAGQTSLATSLYEFLAADEHEQTVRARGLAGLAWIMMESEDDKAASTVFEKLVDQYPDSEFSTAATMRRARFLERQDQHEAAAAMYSLIVDQFGKTEAARIAKLRKAYALQKLGGNRNLTQARDLLKSYLQSPGQIAVADEALYQLGWVLMDLNNSDASIARFQRLLHQHPNSKYWADAALRVVQHQMKAGDQQSAMDLCQQIVDRDNVPSRIFSRAAFIRCQSLAEAEDWPAVTGLMNRLVAATPANQINQKAIYWLAESLYQQRQFGESATQFESIVDAKDPDTDLQPWIVLRLAQCMAKTDRWDEASSIAQRGIDAFGEFEQAHEFGFVQARSLESKGLFDDAIARYKSVVDSQTGHGTETAAIAQWRIGEIHFHRESYVEAIESYYRVDSLYTYEQWRSAALLQAGKCQEHLGNFKHASKLYTQLIGQFPESDMAVTATDRLQGLNRVAAGPSKEVQR